MKRPLSTFNHQADSALSRFGLFACLGRNPDVSPAFTRLTSLGRISK